MESDSRSPFKSKKAKSFKFLHKKDKEKEDREDKKKEKEERKKEREKEKVEKLRAKEEKKRSKKDKKKHVEPYVEDSACMVFGVPLSTAVERSPSHDGIRLPLVVRQCIDYIEQHGLQCEGIYRLSGVKSKVQHLRRCFNSAAPVSLSGHDPHVVASLLKQFLRELPEPVLTADMTSHFEDASQIPGWRDRADAIRQLLHRLPTPNAHLVGHMLAHMGHVIENEAVTKMNYQNVCIVLSPTMRISHRVLNVFFQNHAYLFGDVHIVRYRPPVRTSSAVEGLLGATEVREELRRQDAALAHLHKLLAASPHNTVVQEQLWETQRIHTLLKRKLKLCQREECEVRAPSEDISSEDSQRESVSENTSNNSTSILSTASNSLNALADNGLPSSTGNDLPALAGHDLPAHNDNGLTATTESRDNAMQHRIPKLPKPVSRVKALSDNVPVVDGGTGPEPLDAASLKAISMSGSEAVGISGAVDDRDGPCVQLPVVLPSDDISPGSRSGHVTVIDVDGGVDFVALPPPEFGGKISADMCMPQAFGDGNTSDVLTEAASLVQLPEVASSVELPDVTSSVVLSEVASSVLLPEVATCALRHTDQLSDSTATYPLQSVCVDEELVALVREEAQLLAYHAELLAMNHDLSRKLHAETAEICRLKEEILELHTLYGYRTYSYDSSESEGESESGVTAAADSDNEEELLSQLLQHNAQLQSSNEALVRRIQEEREAVVVLKTRLRQASMPRPLLSAGTVK